MNQIGNSFTSIEQVANQYLQPVREPGRNDRQEISFQDILEKQIRSGESPHVLKFSKHASMRLDEREIALSQNQSERLEAGVQKASEKGIKESLVIVDSLAFIVNVPNQTVVTAMDQTESMENVFTNIDGAVII